MQYTWPYLLGSKQWDCGENVWYLNEKFLENIPAWKWVNFWCKFLHRQLSYCYTTKWHWVNLMWASRLTFRTGRSIPSFILHILVKWCQTHAAKCQYLNYGYYCRGKMYRQFKMQTRKLSPPMMAQVSWRSFQRYQWKILRHHIGYHAICVGSL